MRSCTRGGVCMHVGTVVVGDGCNGGVVGDGCSEGGGRLRVQWRMDLGGKKGPRHQCP